MLFVAKPCFTRAYRHATIERRRRSQVLTTVAVRAGRPASCRVAPTSRSMALRAKLWQEHWSPICSTAILKCTSRVLVSGRSSRPSYIQNWTAWTNKTGLTMKQPFSTSPERQHCGCAAARNDTRKAYVALGSNLGDRVAMIEQACQEMDARGIAVKKTSGLWETEPMYVLDQDRFVNGACEVRVRRKGYSYANTAPDADLLCSQ